jgi:Domain of unknown function (DUF6983)
MAYLEIPVRSDIYSYTQKTAIEGIVYTLGLRYNARMERWVLDIMDASGVMLLAGVKLLVDIPLTYRFNGSIISLPAGQFMIVDETGARRNPTRDDLGDDIKLIYVEDGT